MDKRVLGNERWHALLLELGRRRNKVDACYIPNCTNSAVRAFRGLESGQVAFYCAECSEDIENIFPNLFVEVTRGA
jgi:hypothetical protein